VIALIPLLLATGFGQTTPAPSAPGPDASGTTFSSAITAYACPGAFSSLRTVDFRNLTFPIFATDGKPTSSVPLKNGHFQHDQPGDHSTMDLSAVHYLAPSVNAPPVFALVLSRWFAAGGSSSSGGRAQVFSFSNGRLQVVQQIDWDTHFGATGPTESFDANSATLVIHSAHYLPGDAHCCVSAEDIVTYRWDGAHFIRTSIRTELSGDARNPQRN